MCKTEAYEDDAFKLLRPDQPVLVPVKVLESLS